jgi:hypothetical protein
MRYREAKYRKAERDHIIAVLEDLLEVASEEISDQYSRGMHNGLACAHSIISGDLLRPVQTPEEGYDENNPAK